MGIAAGAESIVVSGCFYAKRKKIPFWDSVFRFKV